MSFGAVRHAKRVFVCVAGCESPISQQVETVLARVADWEFDCGLPCRGLLIAIETAIETFFAGYI